MLNQTESRPRARVARRLAWSLLLVALALPACGPQSFIITPISAKRDLKEIVVARESIWAGDKIAIVDVDGVILNARAPSLVGPPGENPVALFKEKLDAAASDDRVKAIVLRVNSPGGSVTGSDIMHHEVQRFKATTGKPVVACLMDVAASGGYYLACAADEIYAHPTTITGSIGVIVMLPNFAGTLDKIGADVHAIKSGEFKDAGSPFRTLESDDEQLFQELVDDMYERFLAVVAAGRPRLASRAELEPVADGRVVMGDEAVELGLVDHLGTIHSAILAAKTRAELDEKPIVVVQYGRPYTHRPNVYASGPDVGPEASSSGSSLMGLNLPPWLQRSTPMPLYLWAPGW